MKNSVKKAFVFVLAAVMFMAPIYGTAATPTATISSIRKIAKSYVSGYEYIARFNPESVSARGGGGVIAVTAEVTTAPNKVQIQYSTDPKFKKNVKSKTFKNPGYTATIYTGAYKIGKAYVTEVFSYPAGAKGAELANKLQKGSHLTFDKATNYAHTQGIAGLIRKNIRSTQTFKIRKVGDAKKYYVRIRSVYVCNNPLASAGKTYYSVWKTVKVR